jgi:AcrR family transcriptional regulator
MPRKSDKRSRLVASAKKHILRQEFDVTTFSDIAIDAKAAVDNVYYYFKEKIDIALAVLETMSL